MSREILLLALLATGCAGSTEKLGHDVEAALLQPGPQTSDAIVADLHDIADDLEDADARPGPGLRARLAFHLAALGDTDAARRLLDAEAAAYPAAARYVDALRQWLGNEARP